MQASELGHWGMARQAFESGLRCSPQHRMLTSKLLDVLLALGDWHALSDLLAYALKQDQCNPHALHVQSCLQQQTRGLLGKRSSSEPSTPQTTLLHQPLLKRRHMQPQQHTLWHDTLHHSIELSQPSWTSVAAALRQKLVKALSSGSAAACAVNFVLRVDESAKQTSPEQQMSTDVIPADIVAVEAVLENASAPASEGQATQTQAADAQLMSDDAKEAGEKRQRSSRRLGTSRWPPALEVKHCLIFVAASLQAYRLFWHDPHRCVCRHCVLSHHSSVWLATLTCKVTRPTHQRFVCCD